MYTWGVLSQLYRRVLRPLPSVKAEFKTEDTDHRRELRRDLLLERPAISLPSQQRVSHLPSGFPFRTLASCPDSPRCSWIGEKGRARNISRVQTCRIRRCLPSPARGVCRRVSNRITVPRKSHRTPPDLLREPSSESVPQENITRKSGKRHTLCMPSALRSAPTCPREINRRGPQRSAKGRPCETLRRSREYSISQKPTSGPRRPSPLRLLFSFVLIVASRPHHVP